MVVTSDARMMKTDKSTQASETGGAEAVAEGRFASRVRGERGLRALLFRAHLAIGAIGLGMFGLVLFFALAIRDGTRRLTGIDVPMAEAAGSASGGLESSFAELRSWVALADPGFREQRRAAWASRIEPAMVAHVALNTGNVLLFSIPASMVPAGT